MERAIGGMEIYANQKRHKVCAFYHKRNIVFRAFYRKHKHSTPKIGWSPSLVESQENSNVGNKNICGYVYLCRRRRGSFMSFFDHKKYSILLETASIERFRRASREPSKLISGSMNNLIRCFVD